MKYNKLYMNNKSKKKYLELEKKEFLSDKKLNIKVVNNGIILPGKKDYSEDPKMWCIGGVIDEEYHFVEESSTRYLFGGNYDFDEDFLSYIDEDVVFLGPFIEHWGHFICDEISRLWYILDNPQKYKIAYCGWTVGLRDISGNYLELLELLGIKENQLINVLNPTKFKSIIIPDFSFVVDRYYTKEFIKMTDIIVENALKNTRPNTMKVYFSRLELKNNKEYGENFFVEFYKNNKYKIISPEKLSVKEQIYYLNNATDIAMISGSLSHMLMFCKKNINVVILNKFSLINDYQVIIDEITKASVSYVDSYKEIKPVLFGKGPFILEVNQYFKNYAYDNNLILSQQYKDSRKKVLLWYNKTYKEIYNNKKI